MILIFFFKKKNMIIARKIDKNTGMWGKPYHQTGKEIGQSTEKDSVTGS
jgi:hypothetical protein